MPVLNVSLLKGYDATTRQALGESLTSAVRQVIDAAPESKSASTNLTSIIIIAEANPGAQAPQEQRRQRSSAPFWTPCKTGISTMQDRSSLQGFA